MLCNFCSQENLELLRAQDESDMWVAYVDYVDEMIVEGFFTTIQWSLKFLLENTSSRPEPASLFEAVLELQVISHPKILDYSKYASMKAICFQWSRSSEGDNNIMNG